MHGTTWRWQASHCQCSVWQAEPNPAAKQFYEEAAAAAAALGVCIDVYAASEEGMGLAFVEPLCSLTGGALLLYPSVDSAALPQVCTLQQRSLLQ